MNRLLATLCAVLFISASAHAQLKTKNILLITTDGLRWQEVMTGADPGLLNKENGGVQNIPATKQAYSRDTPEARREALLPFFWTVIAKQGQVYGNQGKASIAHITNTMKFSYPGYNEILCGFADANITSNDPIPNKNATVLEWLNRKPEFAGKVAAFSGWNVMPAIINRERCGFTVFAGAQPLPEINTPAQRMLNDLIMETSRSYENEIADSFVFHAAYDYLQTHKPRVLYVSFGETDSYGHSGRYDKVLDSAHRVDDYLRKIWGTIQSMDGYRDCTTLILTTDHGRGFAPTEWKSHGKDIKGAENIWMAFLGPDTPAVGERADIDPVTQNQIAATLAALLGEDYHAAVPQSGAAVPDVLPRAK
jgi:hypothetical protein